MNFLEALAIVSGIILKPLIFIAGSIFLWGLIEYSRRQRSDNARIYKMAMIFSAAIIAVTLVVWAIMGSLSLTCGQHCSQKAALTIPS
jgi:uncharacterized membrane-anchored protein